ncbi:MAG: hypothetical protein HN348_08820, partial [Proteobacteria bacterium]|nr:hypothetical protein [Pseudomonadota bacterium]
MIDYEVGFTPQYHKAVRSLDQREQVDVNEAIGRVLDGHPGVRVHAIPPTPFVSFGVSRGSLRVICLREGKTLVMVHVDHHDPAYQWAKRNKVVRVGKVIRMVPVVAEESASEELGYVEKGPLAD